MYVLFSEKLINLDQVTVIFKVDKDDRNAAPMIIMSYKNGAAKESFKNVKDRDIRFNQIQHLLLRA